jgi:hypothetical protein
MPGTIDEEILVIYSPDCSPHSMQARIERKTRAIQLLQGVSETVHGAQLAMMMTAKAARNDRSHATHIIRQGTNDGPFSHLVIGRYV